MPDSYGGIEMVVNLGAAWIGMLFLMQCIGWFRGLGKGRKDELGCDPAARGDPRMHHGVGVFPNPEQGVSEGGNRDRVMGHSLLGVFRVSGSPAPIPYTWHGRCHSFAVLGALQQLGCMRHVSEWGNNNRVVGTLTNLTVPMSWVLSLVGFVQGPAMVMWQ